MHAGSSRPFRDGRVKDCPRSNTSATLRRSLRHSYALPSPESCKREIRLRGKRCNKNRDTKEKLNLPLLLDQITTQRENVA